MAPLSRFETIPQEIRINIYHKLFEGAQIWLREKPVTRRTIVKLPEELNILFVSKSCLPGALRALFESAAFLLPDNLRPHILPTKQKDLIRHLAIGNILHCNTYTTPLLKFAMSLPALETFSVTVDMDWLLVDEGGLSADAPFYFTRTKVTNVVERFLQQTTSKRYWNKLFRHTDKTNVQLLLIFDDFVRVRDVEVPPAKAPLVSLPSTLVNDNH